MGIRKKLVEFAFQEVLEEMRKITRERNIAVMSASPRKGQYERLCRLMNRQPGLLSWDELITRIETELNDCRRAP